MTYPSFPMLPNDERGPLLALSLAMQDFATVEQAFKGRTLSEERAVDKALERVYLAAEAVAAWRQQ